MWRVRRVGLTRRQPSEARVACVARGIHASSTSSSACGAWAREAHSQALWKARGARAAPSGVRWLAGKYHRDQHAVRSPLVSSNPDFDHFYESSKIVGPVPFHVEFDPNSDQMAPDTTCCDCEQTKVIETSKKQNSKLNSQSFLLS